MFVIRVALPVWVLLLQAVEAAVLLGWAPRILAVPRVLPAGLCFKVG